LPVTARNAARTDEDDRGARRRKATGEAEAKPLPASNSPAEALDRIPVAPEAMARIAEVLSTGSSIVVSDHGISQGGETGEGTDFIVPFREPLLTAFCEGAVRPARYAFRYRTIP